MTTTSVGPPITPTRLPSDKPGAEKLFAAGRAGACVGAVALITMLAFEALAVAAAMPAVATALKGLELYALAFGGPLAASVPGMVLAGRWCDQHGALRPTFAGMALFAVGLLVAGMATDMRVLVAGRVLQGLGGGMLGVTLYVGMAQVVPAALHPRLFGLFATAWVVPGLVGPTLAAWLVLHAGWRWVFLAVLLVLPLAALLLVPAYARLKPHARTAGAVATRPSPVGYALFAAAGALLMHGAAGQRWWVLATGLVAAVGAAFKLLPRGSLHAARGLPAVIGLRGLLAASFATAEVFLPLLLTRDLGWSLMHAGWALSTGAIFWSLGSAVQARISQPMSRQRGLRAGFLGVALGIAVVGLALSLQLHAALLVAGWACAGLGMGLAFPMLSVLTLKLSPPDEQGRNASALQLADALTTTAALALAGLLVVHVQAAPLVLGLAVLLATLGALSTQRITR